MKTNMNQRKLSTLWSFLFAVMMMLVGVNSATAQGIQAYSPTNVLVYSSSTCNATTLQSAFNAAGNSGTNGEVVLLANCTVTGTLSVSTSTFLTAGGGVAALTLDGGSLTVTNGATLSLARPSVNDNIDLIIGVTSTGTLTVNNGATFAINGRGNTLTVAGTGTIENNGTIGTASSTRTSGTTDLLGAVNTSASSMAHAGVYYAAGTLTGTGTWGNIFVTSSWSNANASYVIAPEAQVVFRAAVTVPATGLTFANPASGTTGGNFDVVHTDGALSGTTTMTVAGNYYATTASPTTSSFSGAFTVWGDAKFENTNNGYTFTSNVVTVRGNLNVGATSFASSAPATTVWGNVSILDDDFNPALTMTNGSTAVSSTLVAVSSSSPLTSLTIDTGKTVGSASNTTATTMTNTGTFNVTAGAFTATTLASNTGTVTISTGSFTAPTVTSNAGSITNSTGTVSLTTVTSNAGTIANTGSGSTQIGTVTNTGTISTANGTVTITTVAVNWGGTDKGIYSTGGTTNITNFASNSANVSVSGGSLTIFAATSTTTFTNTVGGILTRTGGTFTINGNLTNDGNIVMGDATATPSGLVQKRDAAVTANYVKEIVAAARLDGVVVKGDFTNNKEYTGNVIVDATSVPRLVTTTKPVGNLTTLSVAFGSTFGVSLANDLQVNGHLIIAQGDFNITGRTVTVSGTATVAPPTGNGVPNSGVYVGANGRWVGGTVIANGNRVALGQEAVAQVNGPLQVTNSGQVQLASNVFVASADITPGSTVKRELGAFCFDFNVAGSTVGVVLQCGVFTITNHANGSIRAQLKAAGYDPDNVNTSVQIAIGNGNAIALTDVVAETSASTTSPTITSWKGVTIVDSQKNFILSSGTVLLNDANLTLRGGFVYDGDWNNAEVTLRTRMLAGSLGATATGTYTTFGSGSITTGTFSSTLANTNGGYLVFSGLQQPNANFIFTGDGVNSTVDGFVLRRVRFDRTIGNSPIAIVDNNSVNQGTLASSLVVSERLEINSALSPGDNNIKWIGGNQTSTMTYTIPGDYSSTGRTISVQVPELVGTGYFWLANNAQTGDTNTITVSGAGTNLKMQFRKSGTAGTSSTVNDKLSNITAFGNGGMSYVEYGYLQSGTAFTTVNSDMNIGANRAGTAIGYGVFELQNSVTFTGNLFITDRNTTVGNNPIYTTDATLFLAPGSADRKTVVVGTFQAANYSANTTYNVLAGSSTSSFAHHLELRGRVIFGAENEVKYAPRFNIARPSRVIFAGLTRTIDYINGVSDVKIQRVEFNPTSLSTFTLVAPTKLRVNDLLMTNGILVTNGGLAMVDLVADDFSFTAGTTTITTNDNLSIVTRASKTAEISRGTGSVGAYTSFSYSSTSTGGAPYTLQYTGSAERFTGDEVPGLPLINQAATTGNKSRVKRLVLDAAGATIEFHKDLIVDDRLELLNGTLDIVTGGFMDLAPNALWVQGSGTVVSTAQARFRFPSTTGNTVGSSTSTYDLFYVHTADHTTGFEYNTNTVRDLIVKAKGSKAAPVSLILSGTKTATGTVRIIDGVLNLDSKTLNIGGNLVVDGLHNNQSNLATSQKVNDNGNGFVSPWFPIRKGAEAASLNAYNYSVGATPSTTYKGDDYGSIVDTNGTLNFNGSTKSRYVVGYVDVQNELFSLPNVLVTTTGIVVFDLNKGFVEGFDQSAINEYRVLSFTQNAGVVALRPGLVKGVQGLLSAAEIWGAYGAFGVESGFEQNPNTQQWNTVNDFTLNGGDFLSFGATMTVGGNYTQGQATATKVSSVFHGGQTTSGTTESDPSKPVLNFQVVGNFTVLEDKAADAVPNTSTRNTTETNTSNTNVHRFYLSYGTLKVGGNYSFFGHADITHGIDVAYNTRGFRGTIEFNGDEPQYVDHVQVTGAQPAAYKAAGQYGRGFFNNVVINGAGIIVGSDEASHMYMNKSGVLNLKKGIVHTGSNELVLFNDTQGSWTVNTLTAGAIRNGGSNSFVQGSVRRFVTYGGTTGGADKTANTGYAFPLGHREGDSDYYRPMTLFFPANLGETISVVASSDLHDAAIINPSLNVAGVNGTLRLNKTSGATWHVDFEKRPALEPNIRLGAQGVITNPVANVSDMRIVARGDASQAWRMFGVYDLNSGTNPDDSYNPNDWLDGIPTFWQEGVDFFAQSVNGPYTAEVRLATSEPFNPFEGSGTVAYLQLIHNSPAGAVDVLVNDAMFEDNFAYQTATAFTPVSADTPLNIALKTANGATELLTINGAVLESGKRYILIAQGGSDGKAFEVKVVDYARSTSTLSEAMQFFFSHGVTNGPSVNVERVTTTTPRTLEQLIAVNAAYGSAGNYLTQLNPGITTLQLKAAGSVVGQYLFDFGAYAGKSMTLLATGRVGGTGANQLMIIGVDADGKVVVPQVTTSNEVEAELPAVFTVHGNYPNPFNPTTNVRFDLPEQANVRIEVVDVIGRKVMTVAPQTMSAGANKVITIDAARLSSGTYFYRVVAEGATRTFVQGSKFTLVK